VKIAVGMPEAERRNAVHQFVNNRETRCFVLHAGQGAAGLTLTVASTVVLLEPFLSAGDEAQAMNRCHRIGQVGLPRWPLCHSLCLSLLSRSLSGTLSRHFTQSLTRWFNCSSQNLSGFRFSSGAGDVG
jgi:hypothetical protein